MACDAGEARVHLARADEAATSRFMVYSAEGLAPGPYIVSARVTSNARRTFTRGYDIVEYPHTKRQHIYVPPTTTIKALVVQVPPGLSVGYVMGVGDQVPPAIPQLGAAVRLLDENDLASSDRWKYDAIVTGVRAYQRRKDLRVYNHRLIEYACNGGTVLVQYNKFEFNQAEYRPWPAKVSSNRVTDETSGSESSCPLIRRLPCPTGRRAARGPGGCRNAGCTFSATRTRITPTWWSWPTLPGQRRAQTGRPGRGARGEGPMGICGLGCVSCRPAPTACTGCWRTCSAWWRKAMTQSAATI